MFEIIMLLAFLWAATSQLLPRKHTDNGLRAGKQPRQKKSTEPAARYKKIRRTKGKRKKPEL